MRLPEISQPAVLIRRYKRFLADVRLANGQILTVHCPNSGSMLGCSTPGSPVIISRSDNRGRKYPWTLEMVQEHGVWIGVHTGRTNGLVREALENGVIDDFGRILTITLDFLIETDRGRVYIEVKNCSLARNRTALFPDAVTVRGTKHIAELVDLSEAGFGTAVLFCVQRGDADRCRPAAEIDPVYARAVSSAAARGVRFLAYQAEVCFEAITITRKIPFQLEHSGADHA
jgi:sugar fermentation stimulation protein A